MDYLNYKLEKFKDEIKFKKVAIIGLGISNIPLIEYLYNLKANITIFDKNYKENLNLDIYSMLEKYNIPYFGGNNYLENLSGFDMIFRSPSCRPDIPKLLKEKQRGAIITTEIEMLLKLAPCKVIGITGTEGKTTTSSIIYSILKEAGYNCFLGGNIGVPLFTKISEIKPEDIIILEMSSFQLMNMDISPQISVVTNIYPDHLDVHNSFEEYINAKKNIFINQKENEIVVLNYDNFHTKGFAKEVKGKVKFFSSKEILRDGYIYDKASGLIKYCNDGLRRHIIRKEDLKLKGVHNYENICAALAATSTFVDFETQIRAIKEFRGVEHRLEFVKNINGVKWYNDSIGTSPASTIAGLNSFDENIILLAGGSDKGLDYTEIGKVISKKVGTLILSGPTSKKIEDATNKALLNTNKSIEIYYCNNLEQEVQLANDKAKNGDIVLLSPASASFDAFKNFEERGNYFKMLVNKL